MSKITINIRKTRNKNSKKLFKIIFNKNNKQRIFNADKYAFDSLHHRLYIRLQFSNVILAFNCNKQNDFLNAIVSIDDWSFFDLAKYDKLIKWNNIPLNIKIIQNE